MAVVGVVCQFCDATMEVTIQGVRVADLTKAMLAEAAKMCLDRHIPTHTKELLIELKEVLSDGD